MFNNPDFYPTPPDLAEKLVQGINFESSYNVNVLEPSIGDGTLADTIKSKSKYVKVAGIEIMPELQAISKSKGYNIIHDDFLTFDDPTSFGIIVANFPFSEGCKHLLKAIQLQERRGGKIRCIINAETIKNPFSNDRKLLIRKLEEHNAEVEYIEDGFKQAARKTDVEVAIVKIDIPIKQRDSNIFENLKKEQEIKRQQRQNNDLIHGDFIQAAIDQYKLEVEAGARVIEELYAFNRINLKEFDKDGGSKDSILILKLRNDQARYSLGDEESDLVNKFVQETRVKYWKALFNSKEFSNMFTSKSRYEYQEQIDELRHYDFSFFNIQQMKIDISKNIISTIEDVILELFEDFTHRYSYHEDHGKNVHLYNGWKSNDAFAMSDKKAIIPLNAFSQWTGHFEPIHGFKDRVMDVHKVFTYLDGGNLNDVETVATSLNEAREKGQTKNINMPYFEVCCYKKGTTHFIWKNKDLIKKMNCFAGIKKGYLPPTYGKKSYENMNEEEKAVIDSFEGKKSYQETYNNPEKFMLNINQMLMLGGGE